MVCKSAMWVRCLCSRCAGMPVWAMAPFSNYKPCPSPCPCPAPAVQTLYDPAQDRAQLLALAGKAHTEAMLGEMYRDSLIPQGAGRSS